MNSSTRREIRGDSLLRLSLGSVHDPDSSLLERYRKEFLRWKYGDPDTPYLPSADDKEFLAYVVRRANEAEMQGTIDPLTELGNRRALHQVFAYQQAEARRSGGREYHGVTMVDVTMKIVNDKDGHEAGDEFLRRVADVMKESARRGTDLVCRVGGDEFFAYLPHTDHIGTIIVADRIRKGIIDISDKHFNGLVSGGVGAYSFLMDDGTALEQTLKNADEALYAARRTAKKRKAETGAVREPVLMFFHDGEQPREVRIERPGYTRITPADRVA